MTVQTVSYQDEVYPHRNNRQAYVDALLRCLSQGAWSEVIAVGSAARATQPGASPYRKNTPSVLERRRVRAMLDAWNGHLDDSYLDQQRLQSVDRSYRAPGRPPGVFDDRGRRAAIQRALNQISRPAAYGGAVMAMSTELETYQPLQNDRSNQHTSFDQIYSQLLRWDEQNCYGVYQHLRRFGLLTSVAGGGSTQSYVYSAASEYIDIRMRQDQGVYGRWHN